MQATQGRQQFTSLSSYTTAVRAELLGRISEKMAGAPARATRQPLRVSELAGDVHPPQPARLHAQQALVQTSHDLRVGGHHPVSPLSLAPEGL